MLSTSDPCLHPTVYVWRLSALEDLFLFSAFLAAHRYPTFQFRSPIPGIQEYL